MDGLMQVEGKKAQTLGQNHRVLYITYDGLTSPLGQSQIIPYVAELTKLGYQYTILSFEKADEFSKGKDRIATLLKQNNIAWKPLIFTSKPPILSKGYDLARMRFASLRLFRKNRFSIIHCRSYPAGQMGLMLKKKFGCRFLFDMRGFWVDERVDGKIWDISRPFYKKLYRYYKGIERSLLKGADHIITLTDNGKKELVNAFNVPEEKITMIPCCVDTDFFDPAKVSKESVRQLKQELQFSDGDYILTYIGKLGTWYLLEEMLDFYKQFKADKPNAKFLLLADYDPEKAKELIDKRHAGLDGIILRKVQRSQVPLYLSTADSAIFFIKQAYSKIASSPIKLAELMSLGIPVVCNGGVGDLDRIVSDKKLGSLITDFNNEEYKDATMHILTQKFDPHYIRQRALDEFSVTRGTERYIKVYATLVNNTAL